MSPLRDSDLTPELRAALRGKGLDVRARAPSKVGRGESHDPEARFRCGSCPFEDRFLVVECHVNAEHHGGRIEALGIADG